MLRKANKKYTLRNSLFFITRACFAMVLTAFILASFSSDVFAKGNPRYASIVLDADTGLVLHERYADKKLHPASLTKIMTLVMAFEALERGNIQLHDRIRISRHAASMVPSKLGLPAGSSIRVRDAIYALVTKSANDVAVALAEHLGGTETNFAKMMTRSARGMGMTKTTFRNASGLHDPRQISTARDMAILARVVVSNYPKQYRYFSRKNFTYNGKTYHNHNRLMSHYNGMDGIKTGYIQASGFNLVASAVRSDRRLIGVVFGGRTAKSRNAHMKKLLDNGFGQVNDMRLAQAKIPVPPRKPGILTAYNALNQVKPASGTHNEKDSSQWAFLNPALQKGLYGKLIGEGDHDPAARERIKTGLMAISAHKGENASPYDRRRKATQSYRKTVNPEGWAIQIGAFNSRAATDKAINLTMKILPEHYATKGQPVISPLQTRQGWLFRARLGGFSKMDALNACKYLTECMPVLIK